MDNSRWWTLTTAKTHIGQILSVWLSGNVQLYKEQETQFQTLSLEQTTIHLVFRIVVCYKLSPTTGSLR